MSAGAFFTSNNSGPLACGQATVIDIDGNTYNTVQIGTQCWMKSSLRTRSKPNGTAMTNSTADNSVTHSERSCPGNGVGTTVPGTEADCTTYGALYEWAVAMNGSILEGAQGICPLGWHIPSDAEWYVLENYLKDNGQTCDANRIGSYDCTAAGTKLKPGGSSGYNGEFGGDRWVVGNYFAYRDSYAVIWSSSRYDSSTAWHRELYSGNAGVIRARNGLTFAFSVRCLKD
ncbi:MAG: fibrobacter succinogenes major paralogous domain-containing protein [Candidatus Falkowbacteria bacterium]|nr:fibrobacter succinogenes major paralogous domain-containing protein [Candidatus Falkowbacteria bacterium]